jgi:RNA polymerase sigma factor (TIGR02999 family)
VDEITELLQRSEAGDQAASDLLLGRIYADLRRIARARLCAERVDTLTTTALVHEAWLAMTRSGQHGFDDRRHYFAYAAKAMRHILIDRARRRAAGKRQADPADAPAQQDDAFELLALDQALARLSGLSPRLAQVVELRLFAGFSTREIAALLEVTERTIERDWLKAQALLVQWLEQEP